MTVSSAMLCSTLTHVHVHTSNANILLIPLHSIELISSSFRLLVLPLRKTKLTSRSHQTQFTVQYRMLCPVLVMFSTVRTFDLHPQVQCSAVHSIILHSIQQIHDCGCSNGLRSWWGQLYHYVGDNHSEGRRYATQSRSDCIRRTELKTESGHDRAMNACILFEQKCIHNLNRSRLEGVGRHNII